MYILECKITVQTYIKYLLKYNTTDFFNDLNIEINTSCNRRCLHCPNSIYDRGLLKNEKLLDEKLYRKIIDELSHIDFDGRISPSLFGEPLLDKRLIRFVEYTRRHLPKVKILVFSNGDYLTPNKYIGLIEAGVTAFTITQHGKTISESMQHLFAFIKNNPSVKNVIKYNVFSDRTPLYNRGGLVEVERRHKRPRCILSNNPVCIDYNGNVILCCNDYFGEVKFGNVRDKNLIDIWKSDFYKNTRRNLRKGKYDFEICKRCNELLTKNGRLR